MLAPPITTSSRLLLMPYYAGRVTESHVSWLNDYDVVRYSEQRHKRHTLESVHAYVNEMNSNPDAYLWAIILDIHGESGKMFGTVSARLDRPNGVANVGIMIGDKQRWGKGYGSEVWDIVCSWLFRQQDTRKIEMGCHYENKAMRNLAESCGMTLEGVRHDHFVVDGKPQHLLLYAKMKPELAKVTINESS